MSSCSTAAPPSVQVQRDSAGEAIFRRDPRFRGGDAAYSVALSGDRRLWLFGDSFVSSRAFAPSRKKERCGAAPASECERPRRSRGEEQSGLFAPSRKEMVRNAIAVQAGNDLQRATLTFFFGGSNAKPRAFFTPTPTTGRERKRHWLWPGPAAALGDGKLLLTFMRIAKVGSGPFGFRAVGSEARLVTSDHGPPSSWRVVSVELPENPWGILVGSGAMLQEGQHLYAYPVVEPGSHQVFLLRWPLAAVRRGELSQPRWWTGERFVGQRALIQRKARPRALFTKGQTELTVHQQGPRCYLLVQSVGFPHGDVAIRHAERPQGPWSAPRVVHRPVESRDPKALIYAAKAHPGLYSGKRRGDEVLLTYATNHMDFGTLVKSVTLYYPHVLRLAPATALCKRRP